MKIKRGLSLADIKNLLYLLIGLMMNTLVPSSAAAGEHIQITREILIESGITDNGVTRGIFPRVVVQTHEGGYIVAGKSGPPWAGRVDAAGNVQWRYRNTTSNLKDGDYTGAAMLPDDSVILCGHAEIQNGSEFQTFGLLTHIDKAGRVISVKFITPNDGKHYGTGGFNCVAINDGVMLFGGVYPIGSGAGSSWIVALDAKGEIQWERLQAIGNGLSHRVLPNHDILLATAVSGEPGVLEGRRISRMSPDATIKAQSILPYPVIEAVPLTTDPLIHLVPYGGDAVYVITLDEQMKTVSKRNGQAKLIGSNRIYYMPDHSLVLFGRLGRQNNGTITASMAWISPDLNQNETLIIQPELASFEIADAIPTGKPGEFVAVRGVDPTNHFLGQNEKRRGAVLAFVQVK